MREPAIGATSRRRLGAACALLVVLLLGIVGTAAPASAHTVSGGTANDYTATLGPIMPAAPGISLIRVENNTRLQLTAAAGLHVIVLGYDDEPYLRVDDTGIYDNMLSPATYANRSYIPSQVGGSPDAAKLPPVWQRVGNGHTVLWHDHREHLSGPPPPQVKLHPRLRQVIYTEDVALTVDGVTHTSALSLVYVPAPSPAPLWTLVGLLALGTALLPLLAAWARLVPVAVVGLVLCDATHSVGIGLVTAGTTGQRLSAFASGNAAEAVAWVLALVGALLIARRSVAGYYCAGTAAAVIAAVGGLGDMGTLASSSAPFDGPVWWARLLTAVTIGVGAGVIAAAVVGVSRLDRAERRLDAVTPAAAPATT